MISRLEDLRTDHANGAIELAATVVGVSQEIIATDLREGKHDGCMASLVVVAEPGFEYGPGTRGFQNVFGGLGGIRIRSLSSSSNLLLLLGRAAFEMQPRFRVGLRDSEITREPDVGFILNICV